MAPNVTQKAFAKGSDFPAPTPGRLRLYSMRFCPYAQRARLVLAHKGIEHEVVNINLSDKPAWFTTKVTSGKVPAVELDDKLLFESLIVCDWLDETYPGHKLTPSDPYRKSRDRMMVEVLYGSIAGSFYKVLLQKDAKEVDDAVKNIEQKFKALDTILTQRNSTFYGGDQPAMADLMMWPHFERFPLLAQHSAPQLAITGEKYPGLAAWFSAMQQVPAVKACAFDLETHADYYKGVREGKAPYDLLLQE